VCAPKKNRPSLGLVATIDATLPLVTALARESGSQATGPETEVIVKEECKELIQWQKI
jgi:hypothetical protein